MCVKRNWSRFLLTFVAVEKQYTLHVLSVCLYSCLSYSAFRAYAPYYIVICRLSASTIFFHIIINGTIFGKKFLEHNMCDFIYNFV
jgi:hypothetical protein